tara:strand:+ start:5631 stop:6239 length:609 start_codon:yes stop_codon:yes gene_type:complete
MKKILITQRIDLIKEIKEERESLDIRLMKMFSRIDMLPIQISIAASKDKKDIQNYISSLCPDGILLSGGNDLGQYPERDNLEKEILHLSERENIPIFGICRGLQVLNFFCEGSLIKVNGHCNTRHKIYGEEEFNNRVVNSFHNYGVFEQNLGKDLKPLANSNDGCIEAIRHTKLPWMAIMWHPERESTLNNEDLKIIKEHFN